MFSSNLVVKVKRVFKFILRYLNYFYLNLKGRLIALYRFELGLLTFVKAVLVIPIESWSMAKLDWQEGYI